MRTAKRKLLLSLILTIPGLMVSSAHAQDLQTEIIYSTRANELAPLISGMAGPEGGATAYRDQLIIRATPEKMPLLLEHLKQLDRPLKSLRITVRRQHAYSSQQSTLGAKGNVRIDNGDISGRVAIKAEDRQRQNQNSSQYSITATEGSAVMIHTGSDVPYLTTINSNTNITAFGQQYVPVQSGMQVTPRLQPDGRVLLDISFQQASLGKGSHNGNIRREGTQSQVQARLGEWMPLSNIEQSVSIQGSGLASQYRHDAKDSRPLEILVEVLP
ncbi:MAG: hypothetical protein ACRERR_01980 [Moraxellaceae bacterium]